MSAARRRRLAGRRSSTLAVAALLLGGCGSPAGDTTSAPEPAGQASPEASAADLAPPDPASPETSASELPKGSSAQPVPPRRPRAEGIVLTTAGSDFGTMLFDGTGQAIYLFDKDTSSRPRCYGECADAWPPVLTAGQPRVREQVDTELLGTVRRRDGSTQVTYAGHPLYYYAHEGKGQVLCHDVVEYGGLWLVVTPAGTPAPS